MTPPKDFDLGTERLKLSLTMMQKTENKAVLGQENCLVHVKLKMSVRHPSRDISDSTWIYNYVIKGTVLGCKLKLVNHQQIDFNTWDWKTMKIEYGKRTELWGVPTLRLMREDTEEQTVRLKAN